jgi:hypothetical protein
MSGVGESDDLAVGEVMMVLVGELRQRYGLADNSFGNRVISKIVSKSDNSLEKARGVLPQYIKKMEKTYPKRIDQLIILTFIDDDEMDASAKLPQKNQTHWREVPHVIAYMEYTPYRPSLE